MTPYVSERDFTLYVGDVRAVMRGLPDESVNCCVTSPPYWGLRDYGVDGQLGLEATPEEYVKNLVEVFREVRRVLVKDGTLWLNLGDSYASDGVTASGGNRNESRESGFHGSFKVTTGSLRDRAAAGAKVKRPSSLRPKNLVGMPWRLALALQADDWILRSEIIWHKTNVMPESVRDRPTKAHETVFLLTKSSRYFYDHEAIREPAEWTRWGKQTTNKRDPGKLSWIPDREKEELTQRTTRNARSVWSIPTKPYKGAHFAVFPPALAERCIKAGCPEGGVVLDPFIGSGTTAAVARSLRRRAIGIELNPEYADLAVKRVAEAA